jgi:hypothetical protein
MAEGDLANHEHWLKLGFNGDVDNVEEDIIEKGGVYVFPAAAGIQMDIVSTSDLDGKTASPLSTGVRTVHLHYLDDTGAEKEETITLDGTTAVATAATKIARVNYMHVGTCGSGGKAAGVITLTEHGGTTYTYSQISLGYTMSRQAVYTVPLGKILFLKSLNVSGVNVAATHWVRFILKVTYIKEDDLITDFFLPFAEVMLMDTSFHLDYSIPFRFPAGVTLKMTAVSDAGSSNELVSCAMRGWLEDV